jgi:Domain of unknown function (DUF6907)
VTITDHCPRWCACDHSADASGTALYHTSVTTSVTIAQPGDLAAPDRLEVLAAQYPADDPGEPSSSPAVEIAVHAGGRYRLIGLTPAEARELAGMLVHAAALLSVPAGASRPWPVRAE